MREKVCCGRPPPVYDTRTRTGRRLRFGLRDQAGTLVDLLHGDTAYPAGSRVLEAGCGVGAQTVTLGARSPQARFTSIDVSADSIAEAGLDAGIRDLYRTTAPDGVFCYTFFKGVGERRSGA